jgi:hypothetical protein
MILSIIALYFLWREYEISTEYIYTGFFWLFIHWVGIIRLNIFDPISIDVSMYFFHALLLWLIIKKKYFWIILLGPVATLQKESFIGFLAVIFLIQSIIFWKNRKSAVSLVWIFSALVLSIFVRGLINIHFPPINVGRSSLIVILFHLKESILDPFRIVRWLTGVFTAFGPLLLLAIWYKKGESGLRSEEPLLAGLCIVHLFMSFAGGGDFTRLAFLGFPFIMTWILASLKDVRGFLFKAAFIFGLPLLKILRNIPDPARTGWDKFYNWYPEFANPVIVILWLGYGVLCILVYQTIDKKLSKLP